MWGGRDITKRSTPTCLGQNSNMYFVSMLVQLSYQGSLSGWVEQYMLCCHVYTCTLLMQAFHQPDGEAVCHVKPHLSAVPAEEILPVHGGPLP